MTDFYQESIHCPSCNHSQDVTLYKTINVTLDPNLRESLFDGEINVFKCIECGQEVFIPIPLLYHDMERQFCVFYHAPENLEYEEFYDQFNSKGELSGFGKIPKRLKKTGDYLIKPHIVFDMEDMIYLIIFRETLFQRHNDT